MSRMERLKILHRRYRRISQALSMLVYVEQVYGKTGNDNYRRHILDGNRFNRLIAIERRIQQAGTVIFERKMYHK